MLQGVENRGSLISVPLALRDWILLGTGHGPPERNSMSPLQTSALQPPERTLATATAEVWTTPEAYTQGAHCFGGGKSLGGHVCRTKLALNIFFRGMNFLTKNAPKFPPKFSAFILWVRKIPQIPAKFPSKCPSQKSKNNSPTSFCRSTGRKNPPEKNHPKKKRIWKSFSEQLLLSTWLASQGSRQKFTRTFRKSSCERGVFFCISGFWVGFGASTVVCPQHDSDSVKRHLRGHHLGILHVFSRICGRCSFSLCVWDPLMLCY